MDALADLVIRLASIPNDDWQRLRTAIDAAPQTVPGLLGWLEHAIDWERDRRRAGLDYPLRGPTQAIPDDELAKSIDVVESLALKYRHDSPEIAALFDIVGEILRADANSRIR